MKSLLYISLLIFNFGCGNSQDSSNTISTNKIMPSSNELKSDTITLAGGCYWCIEAVFEELKGVQSVKSGFMGGHVKNPSYQEVCMGNTGHAEVVQLTYNPDSISVDEILEVFWSIHDPSTLNRQGADVGTQYRSAIFCHTVDQLKIATNFKNKLNSEHVFDKPVVTEIQMASQFYLAPDYHQGYYDSNQDQPYCQMVIRPKLDKFKKVFGNKLK